MSIFGGKFFFKLNTKIFFFFSIFLLTQIVFGQVGLPVTNEKKSTIEIIHADFSEKNDFEIPGAFILTGNIQAQHDSMYIYCNKAYLFQEENYIKLFGNVKIIQNDTMQLNSKYAEYNGIQKVAYASGNVVMKSPNSSITTEKIYYDRGNGVAYYDDHATITNRQNTLKSKSGKYFVNDKKYEFRTSVVITSPQTTIKSNHLDYFEIPGHAYLFGPSTIVNKDHYIYTENGFYDVKQDVGTMTKKPYILTDNKRIEGDLMYYDKKAGFSKVENHVKVTDTINKMVFTSHYAEVYQRKDKNDSIYISKKPLVKMFAENDSTFFHAKEIFITGKDKERIVKGYPNARMFRSPDLSAKADSIFFDQKVGLTKFIGKPVLFRGESQLTGKIMHLLNNPKTEKLDSLKVLTDAFVIQKDSLGTGYNQAKGINLFAKFVENKITEIDLIQNAEMIYYLYNEEDELEGIDKGICSKIHLELEDNKITTATRMINPSSTTYPPEQFPESSKMLPGFQWRGDERIKHQSEIYPPEELDKDTVAEEEKQKLDTENKKPFSVKKETLNAKDIPSNNIKNI